VSGNYDREVNELIQSVKIVSHTLLLQIMIRAGFSMVEAPVPVCWWRPHVAFWRASMPPARCWRPPLDLNSAVAAVKILVT